MFPKKNNKGSFFKKDYSNTYGNSNIKDWLPPFCRVPCTVYRVPFLYLSILYFLTFSCAQQQRLEGGPRDTQPPKLIKELSTPNFQTNFEKQTIELAFDEFIEIKNVVKQVVISPPLAYIPKVERKKGFKTAQFKFDEKEVLKEGVTYAINFGESIKDLTEGNALKNFQFLFSTGDYIDSLKMTGSITDVLTGEPVGEVLFMLYENFADTVVRTEKPYYFGKTDKSGKFIINFLKAGSFKGFALEDQDLNYLFNIPKERIGFTLDTIIITDSTTTDIQLKLFEEFTTLQKPKVELGTYGLVKMGFKRTPYDAIISYDSVGQEMYKETAGDTVKYWYHLKDSLDWNIYLQRDTIIDTFKVRALTRNISPIALRKQRKKAEKIPINPFMPISISFNYPIKRIDTTLINFRELTFVKSIVEDSLSEIEIDTLQPKIDSLQNNKLDSLNERMDTTLVPLKQKGIEITGNFKIDSLNKRTLTLTYDWKEGIQYELELLPGALTDWYDKPNIDTILLTYKVKPKNDFGTINLTLTKMDSTQNYWVQLILKENVLEAFLVGGVKEYQQSFSALSPGQYSLKVIEDMNGNGRWDSGNYDKKLQPEKISTAKIEELRAGWDVDATIEIEFVNSN